MQLDLFHLLFGAIVGLIIIYKKEIINPKKTEICPHDIIETRTLTAQCGWETTAEFCTQCGEQLTKPKTDCWAPALPEGEGAKTNKLWLE